MIIISGFLHRQSVILLFGLVMLSTGAEALAQSVHADPNWDTLMRQSLGSGLIVTTRDFRRQRGALTMISSEALTLRTKKHEVTFPRETVLRVHSRKKVHRLRNGLIGLGIGLGIGAGIGGYKDANRVAESGEGRFFTKLFGLLGAATGGIMGLSNPSHPLVYQAEREPRTQTRLPAPASTDPNAPHLRSSLHTHFTSAHEPPDPRPLFEQAARDYVRSRGLRLDSSAEISKTNSTGDQ